MKRMVLIVFIFSTGISHATEYCESIITSKYTSLKEKDCTRFSDKQSAQFDKRRLDRWECSSQNNWRLFTVIGGERYWIEISYGNTLWSTEADVVIKEENRFGNFQSVDFEQVEWRITKTGKPIALIIPVVAQDPEHYDRNLFRFFVIKLSDHLPLFCGATKSSNEARLLADSLLTTCTHLPKRTIQLK